MNAKDLLGELKKRPLLCDGAMGTQLIARGLAPGACGELWNVDRPADVEAIHRSYRQAGCDLITTNTFGSSRTTLDRHGYGHRTAELNRAGAAVARSAAGNDGWVLGDIGPFGDFLEPVGTMTVDQLTGVFREQADSLYEGGSDAIVVETMSDPTELATAVRAAKASALRPVVATYAFNRTDARAFRTMMGTTAWDAIRMAVEAGADVVGSNCGTSLSLNDYVALAEQIVAAAGGTPVILQPNAGSPSMVNGKLVYAATPRDMADLVGKLLAIGVRIIGGCCGTSPEHLKAMSTVLAAR